MIPTQFAYRIDDLIHLPQGHSVHLPVQLIEICLYLLVVVRIVFVMVFVKHGQVRFPISII